MRNLLPYEQVLIETLGITEEEYFAFRKAQHEYKDEKAGTLLDIRNGEPVSTIALVLSIIGTVAQVAAALLAPRPETPDATNQRRSRDRRFAPRYGFDSFQDLAQYGDPVNLVYTNKGNNFGENPNGGVRVNTSLLWSTVYSNGNAQYVQLLAAIGASDIAEIDFTKTAFGQTLTKLFTAGSSWQYFANNRRPIFADKRIGNDSDPYKNRNDSFVYRPTLNESDELSGFSQAFSPSSSSEFGVFSPVPINVSVFARDDKGDEKKANLGITLEGKGSFWPGSYFGKSRETISEGSEITLEIAKVKDDKSNDEADDSADEIRYAASESIEKGTLYKLGTALFQVKRINGEQDGGNQGLDREKMKVVFTCVKAGYGPWEDYATEDIEEQREELKAQRKSLRDELVVLATNRTTIKVSDYVDSSLSDKQKRIIDVIANESDAVDILMEAVVSFRRNKNQMDELVLAAEVDSFDPIVLEYATAVQAKEAEIENLKDKKERLNAKIDRKENNNQNTRDEEKALAEVKKQILKAKGDLKSLRTSLASALRERAVANGVVDSQLQYARNVARTAQEAFAGIDVDLSGIPDLSDKSPTARNERQTLRKLKNYLRRLEAKVLAVAQVDGAALANAYNAIDTTIATKQAELDQVIAQLADPESFNDFLATKCMVKVAIATYETLSPSHIIHFALKAKVFMRVQGRASKYGENEVKDEGKKYKDSDNGAKARTAMFVVRYKKSEESEQEWKSPNAIFCVRRSADKDNFLPLSFANLSEAVKWQFEFVPVSDPSAEAVKMGFDINGQNTNGETLQFVYLESRGDTKSIDRFYFKGYMRNAKANNLPPRNRAPYGLDEWTLYSTHSDTVLQMSFDSGPEFKIAAVAEQQLSSNMDGLYDGLSLIGFNAYSGAGFTSLRNLSVFATRGKMVRGIELSPASYATTPGNATCLAPDIFLDTLIDKLNGIGQYADPSNIDIGRLAVAQSFCLKQSYFMDGIIADRGAWRAFWSEVAPYSLLELARIGGKDTLVPAVPCKGDGTLTDVVTISALFNQGNILEDSYKEDFLDYGESTEDLIATVIYRDQSLDEPFPRNTSVTVQLPDIDESLAMRRTFDLSAFVTNRHQALHYGMLLVQQRRHIRKAIEFSTFPTEAPVEPGSYIYVQIDENEWDDMHSGTVLDDGSITIPFADETVNGSYSTLIYVPGRAPFKETISYVNGQSASLAAYAGTGALFVLGTEKAAKRVFRVVNVAMEAEGEVKISGVEHPCREEGGLTKSNIVRLNGQGKFDESLFVIDN